MASGLFRPKTLIVSALFVLVTGLPAASPAHAQEAARASSATGVLQIQASAPGAQVWVDNEPVGEAPLTQYLTEGEHMIRVAADGFNPFVRKVRIRAGAKANVTASLRRGGGTVEFQVDQPGGVVVIDGETESPLPVRLRSLPDGTHTYLVKAPGHEPVEGSFEAAPGRNHFVFHTLASSRGLFSITSDPEGARVWLDGQDVGTTPLSLDGIAPAQHLVRVDDGRHPALLAVVDTSDGSRGIVDASLKGPGAPVVIRTGDASAEVRMGGLVLGTGKKVDLGKLAKGRYSLEVSAPGRKAATGRAQVNRSGRAAYRVSWVEDGERGRSRLKEIPPWYLHWGFWTAVGTTTAGATTGAIVAAVGSQPVPIEEGDVSVALP